MKSFIGKSLVLLSFVTVQGAQAATLEDIKSQLQSTPYMNEKPENNDEIFAQYCVGNPNSAELPQPNYENSLVQEAAQKLTLSKVSADRRLIEKAEENLKANIDYIKESIQQVLDSSTSAQVQSLAQTILNELSQSDLKAISSKVIDAYNEMRVLLQKDMNAAVVQIAPMINQKLAGVDMNEFRKIIAQMNTIVQQEVTLPNSAEFKMLLQSAKEIVETYAQKPFNVSDLSQAAQMVLANISTTSGGDNWYMESAINSAKSLKSSIENQSLNEMDYVISDLYYSLNELSSQGVDIKDLSKILNLVRPASLQLSVKYFAASISEQESMYGSISKLNDEQLQEIAMSLQYSLVDFMNMDNGYFAAADKAQLQKLLNVTVKYQGASVLEQIKYVVEQLALNTAQGDLDAVNSAGSISYSVKELSLASPALEALSSALEAEIAKSNSQYVLTLVNDAVETLNKGESLPDDTYSSLSSINYSLEGLNFNKQEQTLLNSFYQVSNVYSAFSGASYYFNDVGGEVKEADHFYFYGGIRRLYQLTSTVPAKAQAAGANQQAHWFLTQLCGEFRDRATMVEAKLKWIQNMNILAKNDQKVIDPQTLAAAKNVWMRINASAYYPYINISSAIWEARREAQERYITVGQYQNVDNPVRGLTVCETKYVFAEYVAAEKEFDGMEAFEAGYQGYQKDCPVADLTDYYDFRGDSNFKHYSPESNGMIWHATSLASGCKSSDKGNGGIYKDEDCKNYFERPYFYRYNAARAGLAAWLFRDDKHADTFATQNQMVAIYPHKEPQLAPFSFGFDASTTTGAFFDYNPQWLGIPYAWNTADIGFNGFTGLGSDEANLELAYTLVRDAVDRHTDWYNSGYNDGHRTSRTQAYSPFVASSYVMSSSDGFTSCGTTVQCPPDGLKRWMFIFRIKAANWYTPQSVINNEPIDFDKMWFDETSFGVSSLADSEHAWDRLGTPQEQELDSILYLINVDDGGYWPSGPVEPVYEDGTVPVVDDGGVG